jgi:PKHD-type hydroxylase
MLVHIPQVLKPEQVRSARARLESAQWVDGRVSAGYQGARVKDNRQLSEDGQLALQLGDMILAALERNPLFISSTLPNRVYPPMFNRYEQGMNFGNHVDNGVRMMPGSGQKIRTDLSCTLFLCEPGEYDGGELCIEDTYGSQAVKLPAGDLMVYPASSVHRVNPVTRGARLASFFWVQSMVRDDGARTTLFEMDTAIRELTAAGADRGALLRLTACYHNLLRRWADV